MSRKYLVPIQLPGNPTGALEAAPKQYVDAMGRQTASDTAPSSPSVADLWYDTTVGRLFTWFDSFWVEVTR